MEGNMTTSPKDQKPLRVLICGETFLPAVNGVTNTIVRAIDHLHENGHEVMVIAPAPGPSYYTHADGTRISVERVTGFRPSFYPQLTLGLTDLDTVGHIMDEFSPDVVHLASPALLGAKAARAATRRSIPSVALFQTDVSGFTANYKLGLLSQVIWLWLRNIHNQADITLAPTETVARELREKEFSRVGVWGRGVDHHQFNPSRRSQIFRNECGVGEDELLVGYLGRLAPEKQVERLAPVSELDGIKVVVIGNGPERERLETLMPKAYFAGFRKGDELGAAMASLDIFVHTGPHETYCQAVQEAMAAGVCAVAPAAGGPLDLITPNVDGLLFNPDSPNSLTPLIERLARDEQLRVRLADAASAKVANRTWSSLGDQLIGHYRRAIELRSVREPNSDNDKEPVGMYAA